MSSKLLIDGIVRQTIVLIAQLSTASGVRAPLAHVADQVFLELARAIEKQGVKRQVVADMFGLALRSYTKKVDRLTESESVRDRTLWEAVVDFVSTTRPTKRRVFERFERDGEREVAAVLRDLRRSGLISVTGTGDDSVFDITSEEVRARIARESELDSVANLVWLKVFRREAETKAALTASMDVDAALLDRALSELEASGRITVHGERLEGANFVVPLGAQRGWEAAVLDHFKTVAKAIATKVRLGRTGSGKGDRIGGSTFTFTLDDDHPHRAAVLALFPRIRGEVQALWDQVAAHNQTASFDPKTSTQIHFYLGQTEDSLDAEEPEDEIDDDEPPRGEP